MTQQETPQSEIIVLVPTGMLGGGFKREHIQYGIARGAHAIPVGSGSTDSGPSYLAAVEAGADSVLGGRTTDTAVLAAVPLLMGAGVAQSWHSSKVAECGGQCTVNPRNGGVLMRVGREAFEIEPLDLNNQCTPES